MLATMLTGMVLAAGEPVRIDLDHEADRQVVVDREAGVNLGHVSTVLVDDGGTILAVYPKGHGRGPIVMRRSADGGRTWSERMPTPASWETSLETPTVFDVGDGSLILFSGLFPIRASRSRDGGRTWSELEPIGEFGGIVAMGDVHRREDGTLSAFFHDDGRFFRPGGEATGTFTLYQTDSMDGGATWGEPREIWRGADVHLCEPGLAESPDGRVLAMLLRENRRVRASHVMFSNDQGRSWSTPVELPPGLTGDRHTASYGPDGRLVVTFRCMREGDPWRGDWVAWVGRWEDLTAQAVDGTVGGVTDLSAVGGPGGDGATYLVRLKDNLSAWDCAYPGLEVLSDGTLVGTTYGTWVEGEAPFILCVRFGLEELDARASGTATP